MTTVLIVEDDDAIRSNITRLLRLEGFEIVSAVNGREGLERMRQTLLLSPVMCLVSAAPRKAARAAGGVHE